MDTSLSKSNSAIKYLDIITGKIINAYHIEGCGAAHNKDNTLCIGCIGVNLIPIDKKLIK